MVPSVVVSMAVLVVLVGLLVGRARHHAGRRAVQDRTVAMLAPATVSAAGAHCGRSGHHYLRRQTGWCCARCGHEVVTEARSSVAVG
jgi:hypothetical protein